MRDDDHDKESFIDFVIFTAVALFIYIVFEIFYK